MKALTNKALSERIARALCCKGEEMHLFCSRNESEAENETMLECPQHVAMDSDDEREDIELAVRISMGGAA